jgi:hypothetical protein
LGVVGGKSTEPPKDFLHADWYGSVTRPGSTQEPVHDPRAAMKKPVQGICGVANARNTTGIAVLCALQLPQTGLFLIHTEIMNRL